MAAGEVVHVAIAVLPKSVGSFQGMIDRKGVRDNVAFYHAGA